MSITITTVKNPSWVDAAQTAINCTLTTREAGDIPFTAMATDPEPHAQAIWNDLMKGMYGPIAPYYGPVPSATPTNDDKRAALAARRWGAVSGGMTVGGVPMQTDAETRANMTAAYILALSDASYTVQWKAADGNFYTLNAPTLRQIAVNVAAFVQKCFAAEAYLNAHLADYSDLESLLAAFDARVA